jgi:hypothetical protein
VESFSRVFLRRQRTQSNASAFSSNAARRQSSPIRTPRLLSDHLTQAGGRAQAKRIEEFKRRSRDFVIECVRKAREWEMLLGGAGPEEGTNLVLGSIFALAHSRTRVSDKREVERLSRKVWGVIESTLRGHRNAAVHVPGSCRFAQRAALVPVKKGLLAIRDRCTLGIRRLLF